MTIGQLGQLPIFNALTGLLPCEGARALPYVADFSINTEYDFDFTLQFNQKQFTAIQGLYIDNSKNAQSVTVTCLGGTEQTIVAPPNSCGYYTLLSTSPPKFSVASSGAVSVFLAFLNFYVPPTVWKTT